MDTPSQFSKSTVMLHWSIAFAMIGSLAFGLYLEELPRSPDKGALIDLHKSIGVLVLLFAFYRVIYRLRNKLPVHPSNPSLRQQQFTLAVHVFLLAATLLMPISGIMMSVGGGHAVGLFGIELISAGDGIEWLDKPGHIIHGLGGKLLILMIVLHAAAALKHELIDKDGTLKRILGVRI